MKRHIYILSILIAGSMAGLLGCKKPYDPKIVAGTNNYLVVETTINTGSDSTIVRLSRTVPISSKSSATPETGATVSIVTDANITYPVLEKGNGVYMGVPINASGPAKYSVKITTKDGKTYQSDFVQAKNSPPIDSVYYKITNNGINIYADTHDPTNSSRYYRWDYTETYIFTSAYNSSGMVVQEPNDTVLFRPPADQIYECWRGDTSSSIIVNSSAKLANDVIADNLLTAIASSSEKIGNRYSILVNQYVLTQDAYNYYQQLRNNSQNLGSIFDPQPSELPGNVHCISNPSEVVVGYITAGAPATTRIFIDTHNLPAWVAQTPYSGCLLDTDYYHLVLQSGGAVNQVAQFIYTGQQDPVSPIAPPASPPIAWTASSPFCVDCTLRGTNIRPPFWVDYTQ